MYSRVISFTSRYCICITKKIWASQIISGSGLSDEISLSSFFTLVFSPVQLWWDRKRCILTLSINGVQIAWTQRQDDTWNIQQWGGVRGKLEKGDRKMCHEHAKLSVHLNSCYLIFSLMFFSPVQSTLICVGKQIQISLHTHKRFTVSLPCFSFMGFVMLKVSERQHLVRRYVTLELYIVFLLLHYLQCIALCLFDNRKCIFF